MSETYEQNPGLVSVDDSGPRSWANIMYALHALSAVSGILTSASIVGAFVFGWPSIIAVIINYVTRDRVRGSWLESHWRWQLRTFWFALAWYLVAGIFFITIIGAVIGWPMIVVTGLWVLYRVIRGWMVLQDKRPMPLP